MTVDDQRASRVRHESIADDDAAVTDPIGFGARPEPRRPGIAVRALRGLSGALAAGSVLLAGLVGVAQWLANPPASPGPGRGMVIGHVVVAVCAVAGQIYADRARPGRAALTSVAVIGIVALLLYLAWWR